jgi:hypothetical protein
MDEIGRAKPSSVKWIEHVYPLIDLGFRRAECLDIIADSGLPPAPKSSCWMCPYRGPKEWKALTIRDRQRALTFEREIKAKDPTLSLRRDMKSVFAGWKHTPEISPLLGEVAHCDSGYCWT